MGTTINLADIVSTPSPGTWSRGGWTVAVIAALLFGAGTPA